MVDSSQQYVQACLGTMRSKRFDQRSITGNQYVKNYEFTFAFGGSWGNCAVVMTSVIGHITGSEFEARNRAWSSCRPIELFDARIFETVHQVGGAVTLLHATDKFQDKQAIANNIMQQARWCKALFIWTDCDREGEYIGNEVREQALKGNPHIEIKRAKFSNTERK